jgi:serine/threonine protein phosphatase PrpC
MGNPPNIKITAFGKTDVGLIREHNEDNLLVLDVSRGTRAQDSDTPMALDLGPKGALFLVCDGMGGAAAGEVASQMAVESIASTLQESEPLERDGFARRLRRAIEDANDRIFAQSRDNQNERGMGTTCTAAAVVDGTLVVGQIGDSRCYVKRGARLAQITKDQSLAWQLMEAGAMTAEEAKGFEHANIILQALGVQERVEVVMSQVALRQGDVILVSSDGLHGPVSDDEILHILQEEPDLKKACDRLVARALEREGPDNVTVVLARFEGPDLPDPRPEELVDFVPYDPGYDHSDPPRMRTDLAEKVTVEVTVPKEAIRLTGRRDVFAGRATGSNKAHQDANGVLSFLLITLIAATAAGAFVKCDRGDAGQRDAQAQIAIHAAQGPAVVAPAPSPAPAAAVADPAKPSASDAAGTAAAPVDKAAVTADKAAAPAEKAAAPADKAAASPQKAPAPANPASLKAAAAAKAGAPAPGAAPARSPAPPRTR